MPRRESRGRRLPTGGYREHRLAIWGVTGCVAVAAGVALTAGLAAASPQLGNIPGTTDRRPALAGLPTAEPSTDPISPSPDGPSTPATRTSPASTPAPPTGPPTGTSAATARPSSRSRPRITPPWHR